MSTFGIGPVSHMSPGGGRYYSKPRRRTAERKEPVPSPSYDIEQGAPIGAKKWLKSLFQADAIHLSVERIADLLGRRPKEEEPDNVTTSPEPISCGPTCKIFHEAVALEKQAAVVYEEEKKPPRRPVNYLVPLAVVAAVGAFLITVAALDAVFGTRSLDVLLSLVRP